MNKGMFRDAAVLMLALLCLTGYAGAAPHSAGTTIMRERGTAQVDIRGRVASIIKAEAPPQNSIFSPGASRMVRRWDVESRDTGGTLLFSDSPEYVKESGILYRDTVEGDARILYYHLNETAQPKKVAVVFETDADLAVVSVSRGATGTPSMDYLHVGKETQIAYFDTQEMHERIHVAKERPRLLVPAMDETVLAPGELVYGVYDFHASAPVRVSVIMYGADVDPFAFLRTAHVLPRDEIVLRGTFRGMNRIITAPKIYHPGRDGAVISRSGTMSTIPTAAVLTQRTVRRSSTTETTASSIRSTYRRRGACRRGTSSVRSEVSMQAPCVRRAGQRTASWRHRRSVRISAIRRARNPHRWHRRVRRACCCSQSIRSSPISAHIRAISLCSSSIRRPGHQTCR